MEKSVSARLTGSCTKKATPSHLLAVCFEGQSTQFTQLVGPPLVPQVATGMDLVDLVHLFNPEPRICALVWGINFFTST